LFVFRGMACVLVVDCIDDDYCLFPPEKQTIIVVNTINYKNTSHSPRKTNNNRRQYNQLQEHKPFPRKNKQHDCCLFFWGNGLCSCSWLYWRWLLFVFRGNGSCSCSCLYWRWLLFVFPGECLVFL
jgi:hypothetical protein